VGWAFFYMFVILKIPVGAALYLVWWAAKQDTTNDDQQVDSGGGGPRHPRHPRKPLPRPPRRGPHGDPIPRPPSRMRIRAGRPIRAGHYTRG
jgi:hypothetical protein